MSKQWEYPAIKIEWRAFVSADDVCRFIEEIGLARLVQVSYDTDEIVVYFRALAPVPEPAAEQEPNPCE